MPSQIPTSFASAAAGGMNQDTGSRGSGRGEGGGLVDWSRPRANGAGMTTFRRPSVATPQSQLSLYQSHQSLGANHVPSPGAYVPPHHQSNSTRNGSTTDTRFSKNQLLSIYKAQKESGDLGKNITDLFIGGWQPGTAVTGVASLWNPKDDPSQVGGSGPDICWDFNGEISPLGLREISDEEKELFSTSVNSPLKPPPQSATKDQNPSGNTVTRKTSFSQNQNNSSPFSITSPTSTRPSIRRRDTSDSLPHGSNYMSSPLGSARAPKDKDVGNTQTPPSLLLRRRTDIREGSSSAAQSETDKQSGLRDTPLDPSATLPNFPRRSVTTGLFPTGNTPTSPWTNAGPALSPMGSFSNFSLADAALQPPTPGEKKPMIGNSRGASRWSKLMNKDHTHDGGPSEKSSIGNLGRLNEADADPSAPTWGETRNNRSLTNETDPYGEEGPGVSSVHAGNQDRGHIGQPQMPGIGNPTVRKYATRHRLADMRDALDLPDFQEGVPGRLGRQHPAASRPNVIGEGEPLSPTETNPYQSPVPETAEPEDVDTDDSDIRNLYHPVLSGMSLESNMNRSSIARNQTRISSATSNTSFPSLGGLGGLGGGSGWPLAAGSIGRAEKDQSAFGSDFSTSLFGTGTMGDLHSSSAGPGFGTSGPSGRSSKLSSLFPPAMQAQLPGTDLGKQGSGLGPGEHKDKLQQQNSTADEFLRSGYDHQFTSGFTAPGRDTESPFRSARGPFDDLLPSNVDESRGRRCTDDSLPSMDPLASAFHNALMSESGQASMSAVTTKGPQSVMTPTARSTTSTNQQQPQMSANPPSQAGQPPQSQQRTMVMPDRMRWLYKDPQGAMQGPFSGLEMHDWFRTGFFTPELLVKKFEDTDFEPLGQLIRRIGNSREPFLVPQIGIPHGQPSNQTNTPWNTNPGTSTTNQTSSPAGAVQPPFAGAFPSFGTTLTAAQQNDLERRKQEEQFLMARQKEYLAQQQVLQKQMHIPHGVHQQLHHHSSAHSLHSQPSFGSVTSPGVYHQTPPQGPVQAPQGVPGFFDMQMRQNVPAYVGTMVSGAELTSLEPAVSRDDELTSLLARQSISHEGQQQVLNMGGAVFGQQPQDTQNHSQQIAAMLAQRAQLQNEQMKHDSMAFPGSESQQLPNERLQQFTDLRVRLNEDYAEPQTVGTATGRPNAPSSGQEEQSGMFQPQQQEQQGEPRVDFNERLDEPRLIAPVTGAASNKEPEVLSLTQQVQKAASAQLPHGTTSQQDFAWPRPEKTGLPYPFPPPPQSLSPLPAPAAQRNRQHLPDALAIEQENRNRSQTSSVETPSAISSLAPWAKDVNDGPKGPSLKEIQEAEARKAAKAEEAAAAARRAILEQERLSSQVISIPAPGLPSSSTWGSGNSPITPSGSSVWGKPLTGKGGVVGTGDGSAKKTLSQIQKEEEARRQKLVTAASAANATTSSTVSAGKRYADLASKPIISQAPSSGNAWTTVGASGKAKLPPVPSTPATRVPSGTISTSSVATTTAVKNKPATGGSIGKSVSQPQQQQQSQQQQQQPNANEAFTRWAKGALAKGLNSNINVDDFVQQLLMFPPEAEIISESVYANSQTMDGRRFAEEFLRRRKLAEKGVVDVGFMMGGANLGSLSSAAGGGAGGGGSGAGGNEKKNASGWSEVAKKGPVSTAKDGTESNSSFKVVAAKKKGKK